MSDSREIYALSNVTDGAFSSRVLCSDDNDGAVALVPIMPGLICCALSQFYVFRGHSGALGYIDAIL